MSAAQDFMEAAGHAYTTIHPLMGPLDSNLKLCLNFDGPFPGLDIWIHHNTPAISALMPYKLGIKNKAEVDDFVNTIKTKMNIAA